MADAMMGRLAAPTRPIAEEDDGQEDGGEDAEDAQGEDSGAGAAAADSEATAEALAGLDEYKSGYYVGKFQAEAREPGFLPRLVQAYITGLAWVMRYYFQGVPSWTYYFPFHYAPFASDIVGIGEPRSKTFVFLFSPRQFLASLRNSRDRTKTNEN